MGAENLDSPRADKEISLERPPDYSEVTTLVSGGSSDSEAGPVFTIPQVPSTGTSGSSGGKLHHYDEERP